MTGRPFTYGSVCSGIEAATVAWHPLGWKPAFFSEIEAFPRAVLAHHYPEVPLHGDFTTIQDGQYEPIDLLVGGTPCQSFSVAGLRGGLSDQRGNLTLEYLRLAERLRPRWLVWENVPGVFSSLSHDAPDPCPPDIDLDGDNGPQDGEEVVVEDEYDADESHAFACLLAGFSELGYGFAYRVLDAQYVRTHEHARAVPQRRRRVFVVGYLGDWRRAAAVLLERDGLSGNPPPRRQAGQIPAGTLSSRPSGGGGLGTDFDLDGGLIEAFGGNDTRGPIDVSTALNSHGGPHGRLDFDSETFVAHSLRAEGYDASEDGTGRGTPLVPVAYRTAGDGAVYEEGDATAPLTTGTDSSAQIIAFDTTQITSAANYSNPKPFDPCHPLAAGAHPPAIAYSIMPMNSGKDFKARVTDVAQPIMAGGPVGGDQGGDYLAYTVRTNQTGQNGPGFMENCSPSLAADEQPSAVAFALRGRDGGAMPEVEGDGSVAGALRSASGGSTRDYVAMTGVRRLTPRECERLQGFTDDYTAITFRGAPAADGPRYKALGNSMAINVMAWIGQRIAAVEALQINQAAA